MKNNGHERNGILWILVLAAICLLSSGCATAPEDPRVTVAKMAEAALAEPRSGAPDPSPNHLALSRALMDKGLYRAAGTQLAHARKKEPDNPEIIYLTGLCFLETGEDRRAADAFLEVLDRDRSFAPAYNGMGRVCLRSGDTETAMASFEQAIVLNPARSDFFNNLGAARLRAGDLTGAETALRESLQLDGGNRRAANNLAICLGRAGRFDKALAALEMTAPSHIALNNMGAIYEIHGRQADAAAMYRRALAENPAYAPARRNLARLCSGKRDAGSKEEKNR